MQTQVSKSVTTLLGIAIILLVIILVLSVRSYQTTKAIVSPQAIERSRQARTEMEKRRAEEEKTGKPSEEGQLIPAERPK